MEVENTGSLVTDYSWRKLMNHSEITFTLNISHFISSLMFYFYFSSKPFYPCWKIHPNITAYSWKMCPFSWRKTVLFLWLDKRLCSKRPMKQHLQTTSSTGVLLDFQLFLLVLHLVRPGKDSTYAVWIKLKTHFSEEQDVMLTISTVQTSLDHVTSQTSGLRNLWPPPR